MLLSLGNKASDIMCVAIIVRLDYNNSFNTHKK